MTAFALSNRTDDFIPEVFRRLFQAPVLATPFAENEIRIDVRENDKQYLVSAEMPGIKKEDIRVSITGNLVSISAEVNKNQEEKEGNGNKVLVKETFHGSISRSFSLAHEVDRKGVEAKLKDGVLLLTLPKRDSDSGHLVPIQ